MMTTSLSGADGTASWNADPTGRYQYRYWDGSAWTDQVSGGAGTTAMALWQGTHAVDGRGAPAWSDPDPALAPTATLDPRLEVQLVELRADGWAHVVCSNGWPAWVDGGRLQAVH